MGLASMYAIENAEMMKPYCLRGKAGLAQDRGREDRQRVPVDVADQRNRKHGRGRNPSEHKLRSYPTHVINYPFAHRMLIAREFVTYISNRSLNAWYRA